MAATVEPTMQSETELSDELKLAALLDQHRVETDAQKRADCEKQILLLVDHYFRLSLRPVMAKLFGPQMMEQGAGDSRGFTVLLNDFFVKVLESRPDEVWRARSARDLRNWSSTVMANMMRDHLRRKRRGEDILRDDIAPLYELRKKHFEQRFPSGFESMLDHLSNLPEQERRLVQLHYLDGMSWEETADELGLSKSAFYRLRTEALAKLHAEITTGETSR